MSDNSKKNVDEFLTVGESDSTTVFLNKKDSVNLDNEATVFVKPKVQTESNGEDKTVLLKPETPSIFCKSCGTKNNANAAFCTSCGASLTEKKCPRCGSIVEGQNGFCTKCGYSFAAVEPPKKNNTLLVTIVSVVTCIALVIGGVLFMNRKGDDSVSEEPTIESTPEEPSTTVDSGSQEEEIVIPVNPNQDFTGTPANRQVVNFGMYEIDGDITNGKEPIEWTAFHSETDNRIVLICNYVIDYQEYGSGKWETCYLRKWLNNDFLNEAFDSAEQSRIQIASNDNSSISIGGYTTVAGSTTSDRVFIMRANALGIYFSNLAAPATSYAKQLANTSSNLPYSTRGMVSGSGPVIGANGSITSSSSTKLGVRPCIFIQ